MSERGPKLYAPPTALMPNAYGAYQRLVTEADGAYRSRLGRAL